MKLGVAERGATGPVARPAVGPVPGYRLIRRIGGGGSGDVWRAEGPGGFPAALKFIPLAGGLGAGHLRALAIARAVRHPHLLGSFGAWADDERIVLASELADGSLWDRCVEARRDGLPGIPRDELIGALLGAARGIDYLNEPRHGDGERSGLGVQHRDIKPQNILLVAGVAKVADLGAARWMEEEVTGHSGQCWTPAYAAPEFFLGATARQSDQYSLAATYVHLRIGRPPFVGDPAAVMAGHLMEPPDLASLDEAERPIVARALAKRPEDRWPTCLAFVEALRDAVRTDLDEDDSVWDALPPSEGRPTALGVVAAQELPDDPTEPDSEGPSTWTAIRTDPARRRRQRLVVAALAVVGGLAVWAGVRERRSAPEGLLVSPAPSRLAEHAPEPPRRVAAVEVRRSPEEAGPAPVRPATPITRRVALRPPLPATADLPLTAPAEASTSPGPVLRLALARLALPLVANPTFGRPAPIEPPPAEPAESIASPSPSASVADRTEPVPEVAPLAEPSRSARAEEAKRRGDERAKRGDLASALGAYTEAIRLDPGLAEARAARGEVYLGKGDPLRALADLDEAIRLRPDSAPALSDRGLARLARGDVFRAIADLDAALRIAPASAVIHYNRGIAYARLGDRIEAASEFDAALRLDPGLTVARTAHDRLPSLSARLSREAPRASRAEAVPPPPSPVNPSAAGSHK